MKIPKLYKVKNNLSLLFLLLAGQVTFAQFSAEEQKEIDSLNAIINNSKSHDTTVVLAYFDVAAYYYLKNPDSAITICKNAEQISEKINYIKGRGESYGWLGYLLIQKGEIPSALAYNHKSLSIHEELGNKEEQANCLINIGSIHQTQGDIPLALKYFNKSLKIYEEIGDKEGIGYAFNNIGFIYDEQGGLQIALEYYHKSLKIQEEIGNKEGIATSLINIGFIHKKKGNTPLALKYYHKSLRIYTEIGDKEGIATSLNNIGCIYETRDNIPVALEYYHKSLEIREKIGDKQGIVNSLNIIGTVDLSQGELKSAKARGKRALQQAQEIGNVHEMKIAASLLYDIADKQGNWQEALELRNLEIRMRDSINNEEAIKATANQQARYEYREKAATDSVIAAEAKKVTDAQLTAQKMQLEQEKTEKNALYGGILVLMVLGGLMFNRYRVTRKQKQVIEEQKKLVEKQKEERTIMMQETHHRMKNNMQIVKSLLGLQANKIDDEKIVAMFQECQNRIAAMAIIHENMYQSDELSKIDTSTYIESLVEQIAFSYKLGEKIDLKLDIPSVKFGSKTLIPLGLIINEIMTNAFKYAFADRESGEVTLEVQEINNNEYQMIIGDNGIGMPLDFKHQESNSLGTELVQIFTEQLDGTIERVKQAGTVFKITFIPQEG